MHFINKPLTKWIQFWGEIADQETVSVLINMIGFCLPINAYILLCTAPSAWVDIFLRE